MADKFPERWSIPSPGARGIDRATGMRLAGGGGAVTADRQIKPNRYWNLKMVYSPVTTAAREVDPAAGQCVVPLQNRYSFTDLSELTCRWQALAGDKVLASGESHIAAKPRSTVDATFPATARHGHPAPGIHPPRWPQRLRRPLARERLPRPRRSRRPGRRRAGPPLRDRPERRRANRRNPIGPRQAHRPDHLLARRRPGCRPRRADPQPR